MNLDPEAKIFAKALEIADQIERTSYIRSVCGEDSDLAVRVENLVANFSQAASLFPTDPSLPNPEVDDEIRAGAIVGHYKILERLAEGGMGVVYIAQHTERLVRKVALKIIKLGMDTKQVVARFEAERVALALMQHPNIATVLDCGSTESGRPYFVMELVAGISITEYCDNNKLNAKQRLELFVPVCEAIQHAHHKGIIHRDIKPSNVLVTEIDGVPIPKVIDFGVAKATNQQLTTKTLFTNYGQMIGTPAYMSPEQAEGSQLDIDTRSDVYSLGVLLYELLTGSQPFPERRLRNAGWREMQRIIQEEEPQRPSYRFKKSTVEEQSLISVNHGESPRRIGILLKRELDWIVMRCLEKDRKRRYSAAGDLALDIENYFENRPIRARPRSTTYSMVKFVRRHKTTTSLMLLLIAVSTSLGRFVWREYNFDMMEVLDRMEYMIDAGYAASVLTGMFEYVGDSEHADQLSAIDVLNNAKEVIAGDVRSGSNIVEICISLGYAYERLAHFPEAVEMYERALGQAEAILGNNDDKTMRGLMSLGRAYAKNGEIRKANRTFAEAMDRYGGVWGSKDAITANYAMEIASVLIDVQEYETAETKLKWVIDVTQSNRDSMLADTLLTRGLAALGLVCYETGRYEEAVKMLTRSLERHLEKNRALKFLLNKNRVLLGQSHFKVGNHTDAEQHLVAGFLGLENDEFNQFPERSSKLRLRAANDLVEMYTTQGKTSEVDAWRAKIEDLENADFFK